jgi:hypothetical protein
MAPVGRVNEVIRNHGHSTRKLHRTMSSNAATTAPESGGLFWPSGSGPYFTEAAQRFTTYWFSLPRSGLLPERSAFNPADIKDLLPMILLRDVDKQGEAHFRLVGTGIRDLLGEELTGLNPTEVTPPEEIERYQRVSQKMLAQPCGAYARLVLETDTGIPFAVENISFPFAPKADGGRQTLGLFAELDQTLDRGRGGARISHFSLVEFIDIGAGIPNPA